ncbi:hypothetical protein SVAN01_06481 [Stagonosporopsis vannaccii]|nr:hypothetical protein SVAN01_06481 [Stagonosporopsis vannaccii]
MMHRSVDGRALVEAGAEQQPIVPRRSPNELFSNVRVSKCIRLESLPRTHKTSSALANQALVNSMFADCWFVCARNVELELCSAARAGQPAVKVACSFGSLLNSAVQCLLRLVHRVYIYRTCDGLRIVRDLIPAQALAQQETPPAHISSHARDSHNPSQKPRPPPPAIAAAIIKTWPPVSHALALTPHSSRSFKAIPQCEFEKSLAVRLSLFKDWLYASPAESLIQTLRRSGKRISQRFWVKCALQDIAAQSRKHPSLDVPALRVRTRTSILRPWRGTSLPARPTPSLRLATPHTSANPDFCFDKIL